MSKEIHAQFQPNITPYELFKAGAFGGTYWRPIYSEVTKKFYYNQHLKYSCLSNLDTKLLTGTIYNTSINYHNVKVGSSLEFWHQKGWITHFHPYGWVEWYCSYYEGNRCTDDERQIKRWLNLAGPKGRFRRRLASIIINSSSTLNDYNISPKIRQVLLHWAYKLTPADLI